MGMVGWLQPWSRLFEQVGELEDLKYYAVQKAPTTYSYVEVCTCVPTSENMAVHGARCKTPRHRACRVWSPAARSGAFWCSHAPRPRHTILTIKPKAVRAPSFASS
jgi:hypothetical protein